MAEVARDSQQSIHEDYGTLITTDYVLLICYAVWIIGMHHANINAYLVTLQVFELPKFLLSRLLLPSHSSELPFGVSLKNFDQNIRFPLIPAFRT